jgi:hypothetical protein
MNDKLKSLYQELEKIEEVANQLEYFKNEYFLKYNQDVGQLAELFNCEKFTTALKVPGEIYKIYFHEFRILDDANENEKFQYYNWWLEFNTRCDKRFFPIISSKMINVAN